MRPLKPFKASEASVIHVEAPCSPMARSKMPEKSCYNLQAYISPDDSTKRNSAIDRWLPRIHRIDVKPLKWPCGDEWS